MAPAGEGLVPVALVSKAVLIPGAATTRPVDISVQTSAHHVRHLAAGVRIARGAGGAGALQEGNAGGEMRICVNVKRTAVNQEPLHQATGRPARSSSS